MVVKYHDDAFRRRFVISIPPSEETHLELEGMGWVIDYGSVIERESD